MSALYSDAAKYHLFLPIDPPWPLNTTFDCSEGEGHLLQEDQHPGGRGSEVNVLTPSQCPGRVGPQITPRSSVKTSSVSVSPAGAGWLLKAKSHSCVPITCVQTLTPVPLCRTVRWPGCRVRLPGLESQHWLLLA